MTANHAHPVTDAGEERVSRSGALPHSADGSVYTDNSALAGGARLPDQLRHPWGHVVFCQADHSARCPAAACPHRHDRSPTDSPMEA